MAAAVGVGLSLLLVRPLAHGGLALAISGNALTGGLLLLWHLRRRLGHLGSRVIAGSAAAAPAVRSAGENHPAGEGRL